MTLYRGMEIRPSAGIAGMRAEVYADGQRRAACSHVHRTVGAAEDCGRRLVQSLIEKEGVA